MQSDSQVYKYHDEVFGWDEINEQYRAAIAHQNNGIKSWYWVCILVVYTTDIVILKIIYTHVPQYKNISSLDDSAM